MLTGSISAIRFGANLGTTILGPSVSSMRSWKTGKTTPVILVGQTDGIISKTFNASYQWAILAFYVYSFANDYYKKPENADQSSET